MDMLKPMAGLIAESGPFRVIIVDSVIALFRVEFVGRGELSERQQKLGQYLSELVRCGLMLHLRTRGMAHCADGRLDTYLPLILVYIFIAAAHRRGVQRGSLPGQSVSGRSRRDVYVCEYINCLECYVLAISAIPDSSEDQLVGTHVDGLITVRA